MHILVAPNAFKNSLDASEAADAIREGLMASGLTCSIRCFPIADGGDGTSALLTHSLDGRLQAEEVTDPCFRPVSAYYGWADREKTAVIGIADGSGLRLVPPSDRKPLLLTSVGTGQLIQAALSRQPQRILLAMGGSATVDGGCGMLAALGLRFLAGDGRHLRPFPADLLEMAAIDASALDPRLAGVEVTALCDVSNTLLGPCGAAAVFGPQKGADPAAVKQLELLLGKLAAITFRANGRKIEDVACGGAAGGAAAGFYGWLNASLVNGIGVFMQVTGFDKALQMADLVITGEGSLDRQTLSGKGPLGVALAAKQKGIRVIGMAGSIEDDPSMFDYFDELIAVSKPSEDLETAIRNTRRNLREAGHMLGRRLSAPGGELLFTH